MNSKKSERFWEIDFLRGIAISLMVVYHLGFDLHYFVGINLAFNSLSWQIFQIFIASLFLLLVGVSMSLKYSKHENIKFSSFLKRGSQVFALGLLITLVTYFFTDGPIWFGILHLIGASIILGYFFLKAETSLRDLKFKTKQSRRITSLNLVIGTVFIMKVSGQANHLQLGNSSVAP